MRLNFGVVEKAKVLFLKRKNIKTNFNRSGPISIFKLK